jgi:hypothetical protein
MIAWRDGKQQTLTEGNGLPCDAVYAFVKDSLGTLWLYAQCGLIGIADTELQKWWKNPDAILQVKVLDAQDGALPEITAFNGAAKSPDGRLWFANGFVLQMIDPVRLAQGSPPPQVHIEGLVVDRQNYTPERDLRLPPNPNDLQIDYTAPNFIAPQKVRFRYKLEGHDADWQEAGARRQAFYTDLSPRKYQFRVIASNRDGVWNEAAATLDFRIAPAWYQTNWFRAAIVIAFIVVVWSVHHARLRHVARSITQRSDERLAERTRMARETP